MKKKTTLRNVCVAIAAASTTLVSCKKNFEAPPAYIAPDIEANISIADLKAMEGAAGNIAQITDSLVISGTVVANDQSGNIYHALYIQDPAGGGGIQLYLAGSNLYSSYPVGMQLFVKCKGLALTDYNGSMELGVIDNTNPNQPKVTGVPSSLFDKYLVKGSLNNPVVPKVVSLAQLNDAASNASAQPWADTLQNTLVQISNAEVANAALGSTYADTSNKTRSVSVNIQDCAGQRAIFYTSGFATFAGLTVPSGNGTVTAIYTPYNGSTELLLRDTSDVRMNGTRCNGGGNSPTNLVAIADLRAMYPGSNYTINANTQITGVVISDASSKNVQTGSVVIQQGNSGVSVYFGGTITYHIGDSVVIDVTGSTLQRYNNGAIEVSTPFGTPAPAAVATGKTIVPQELTIQQLGAYLADGECTLVKIKSATASGGSTFSGSRILTDASGSVPLFTSSSATFAGTSLPTSCSDWVGYAIPYNNAPEFEIRNTSDVTASTGCSTGPVTITTLAALRGMYAGSNLTLPGNTRITGVVISSTTSNSVVIQQGTSGVSVYFGGSIPYQIGDSVVFDVSGATLELYNGSLEVSTPYGTVASTDAVVASGVTVTPQVVTIADLNASLGGAVASSLEYTLVQVQGAQLSGSGSNQTLTDASGNIKFYSPVAGLPTGTNKDWTGYCENFGTTLTKEFQIRTSADVQ